MHRLNIQIKNLLNISNQNVDFDAIVMENKYLKQRLDDVLNEKKLWNKTVTKYKTMLNNNCQNTGKILSYDQIAKHINSMTSSMTSTRQKQPQDQTNLKQICITLLETLTEKNLLLQHQRKTNKLLAQRILELEKQNGTNVNTCDVLLKGYSATGGNAEMMLEIEDEKSSTGTNVNKTEDKNTNINKIIDLKFEDGKMKDKNTKDQEERHKNHDGDREHKIIARHNIINHKENNFNERNYGIEDANTYENVDNIEGIENVRGMEYISHNMEDTAENNNSSNTEYLGREKCNEQIQDENGKVIDNVHTHEQRDISKHIEINEDHNNINKEKDQNIQETDGHISFEDHEDIQSLPLELQKLVLQAMKDLEQDEIKSL
ncbi:hypothetical protein WDU94_011079 [Cyamophila willieti]